MTICNHIQNVYICTYIICGIGENIWKQTENTNAFGLVLRSQQNMYNKIKQKWTQFQRLRYTILELIFF